MFLNLSKCSIFETEKRKPIGYSDSELRINRTLKKTQDFPTKVTNLIIMYIIIIISYSRIYQSQSVTACEPYLFYFIGVFENLSEHVLMHVLLCSCSR